MAGLFKLENRSTKATDKEVVRKAGSKNSPAISIKGGTSLIARINAIVDNCNRYLGKYKDNYICIRNIDELNKYITECCTNGICAIDTETTGLDPIMDKIVGFSIYTPYNKAAYIPINHVSYITNEKANEQLEIEDIRKSLQFLVDSGCKTVWFNAKFDIRVLRNQIGVRFKPYYDGYIAMMMLNENEPEKGLKALHKKYCMDGQGDAFSFDKLFSDIPFSLIPINCGYLYAARDAEITYQLYQFQLPYLTKNSRENIEQDLQGASNVFWNIEMPLVPIVADMEDIGVAIDFDYANKLHDKYSILLQEKTDNYNNLLKEYNISKPYDMNSPKQVAELFYDELKVGEIDRRNPRGTGEDILVKMNHPIANAILEYRAVSKLVTTYIDKLPKVVNPKDNRIHCSFNQNGTVTGRFSSSNPNLQNIPSHNKDIRPMFVATEGYALIGSDYSQQEPRITAHMCGDKKMIQSYLDKKDLYAEMASTAFKVPYEDCLEFYLDENGNKTGEVNKEGKERRTAAKSLLLGITYGRGIDSVAEQLHTTPEEAQVIQDKIFKGFPKLAQFEHDTQQMARDYGYVKTLWGRKRRLPAMQLPDYEFHFMDSSSFDPLSDVQEEAEVPYNIQEKYLKLLYNRKGYKKPIFEQANKEGIYIDDNTKKIGDATRQCVNSVIQGSAGDLTKLAMLSIGTNQRLKELGFRMLIQVHDEIIGEAPLENAKEAGKVLQECMITAAKDLVTGIKCDVEYTKAWYGEAIEL